MSIISVIIDRISRNATRTVECCCAMAVRLVPRQYRFDAALLLARVTVPLLRHTEAYREQQIRNFHDASEIALHLILNALTKNQTPFDPPIVVNGFDHFAQAFARGKGVLVIGHHAALTLFMVRLFYNKGFDPIIITPDACLRVGGTLVTARTVQPSPMFLVRLRSKLKSGELVCGMPDRGRHHGRRTVEFATAKGQVILAPAMIQVAARCGAEVLFTAVRLEDRQLVATILPRRQLRPTALAQPLPKTSLRSSENTPAVVRVIVREPTAFAPARRSHRGSPHGLVANWQKVPVHQPQPPA